MPLLQSPFGIIRRLKNRPLYGVREQMSKPVQTSSRAVKEPSNEAAKKYQRHHLMGDPPEVSNSLSLPLAQVKGADQPFFSIEEFYEIFLRTRFQIIFSCILVAVAGFLIARQEVRYSPTFSSSTDFEILPSDFQLNFARTALGGTRDSQIASIVRSISEEIMSDEVLARASTRVPIKNFAAPEAVHKGSLWGRLTGFINWLNYGDLRSTATDPFNLYRNSLDISSIDGSFVLRITATLDDAEQAANLANSILSIFLEIELERKKSELNFLTEMYLAKLKEANAELRSLIDREIGLGGLISIPSKNVPVSAAPEMEAQLKSNRQSQEIVVHEISRLRSELVSAQINANYFGTYAIVLRKAQPAQIPNGPTPMVKGLAYGLGMFVFLMSSLIFASAARIFFNRLRESPTVLIDKTVSIDK